MAGSTTDPTAIQPTGSDQIRGKVGGVRWAKALAATMLSAFALVTVIQIWDHREAGGSHEEIQQIPVPVETVDSAPNRDTTAPDPGDHP